MAARAGTHLQDAGDDADLLRVLDGRRFAAVGGDKVDVAHVQDGREDLEDALDLHTGGGAGIAITSDAVGVNAPPCAACRSAVALDASRTSSGDRLSTVMASLRASKSLASGIASSVMHPDWLR